MEIHLPPLRERGEGLFAVLALHFLSHYASRYRRAIRGLDPSALQSLMQYAWPGRGQRPRVRARLERAVLMCRSEQIQPGGLGLQLQDDRPAQNLEELSLESVETILIRKALQRFQGNVSQAAATLV